MTGIVFDGPSVFDETFTHEVYSLSASWTGFYDDESVIVSYNVCFSFDPTSDSVFACHQTRSKSTTVTLETPLEHGEYCYVHILLYFVLYISILYGPCNLGTFDVLAGQQVPYPVHIFNQIRLRCRMSILCD